MNPSKNRINYWNNDGYFKQDTVDASNIDQGIIRAKILSLPGYGWKNFNVVNVEESFAMWYIRDFMYWAEVMGREPLPIFAGPPFPSVASYGLKPDPNAWNRSQFSLNNAVKATGLFAPKREVIDDIMQGLYEHWYDSPEDKMLYLLGLLSNLENLSGFKICS